MTFAVGFEVVVGDGINFSSVVMFLEGLFFLRVAHGEIRIRKDKEYSCTTLWYAITVKLNYSSDVEKYIDLLDIPPQRLVDCKITEQELISNLASRLEQTKIDLLNTSKKLTKPYKIAVVVAMWGEHNRLRKKTTAN